MFILFILRETESRGGAERERERERIPRRLCAMNTESDMGLNPINLKIMTSAEKM